MDLAGAFHQLFVHPESASKLAFALTDDLTLIYHTGMFGWTGMPGAFAVVSRVIARLINSGTRAERLSDTYRSRLSCCMYVDDVMAVCRLSDVTREVERAHSIIDGLMGEGSVEDEKTETGRKLNFIGWTMDLDNRSVSIARRNYLSTLHGFLSIDEESYVCLLYTSPSPRDS